MMREKTITAEDVKQWFAASNLLEPQAKLFCEMVDDVESCKNEETSPYTNIVIIRTTVDGKRDVIHSSVRNPKQLIELAKEWIKGFEDNYRRAG